jgi:hypothetical protein
VRVWLATVANPDAGWERAKEFVAALEELGIKRGQYLIGVRCVASQRDVFYVELLVNREEPAREWWED